MKKMPLLALAALALAASFLLAPRAYTAWRYGRQMIAEPAQAPQAPVAVVFGAGLWRGGRPTPVLQDRVTTAVELYQLGKVSRLLLSGTGGAGYDEPRAMRQLALALGVPDGALVLDEAGFSTYETCLRARDEFGVQQAVLVTQAFHLPRALMICDALGLTAQGVIADRRQYLWRSLAYWNLREVLATANAVWELAAGAGRTARAD